MSGREILSVVPTKSAALTLLLALAPFAPLVAQTAPGDGAVATASNDTRELAQALVASWSAAADDPDASLRALVAAALAHPRSPVAWLCVEEATQRVGTLLDPTAFLAVVPNGDDRALHGLLAQKCNELRWYVKGAVEGDGAAGPSPEWGYCREARTVGPLGDGGDRFVGVVMTPELAFPPLGSELPGRGRAVKVVVTRSAWASAFFDPARELPGKGCFYSLLRCEAGEPVETFLEFYHEADAQVFVDGREVHRQERWRATGLRRSYIGLALPKGVHEVVVKTCTNERTRFAARFVDADGWPNAKVHWLAGSDDAPVAAERATATPAVFVAGADVLARAAERSDDGVLAVAALLAAVRDGHADRGVDLATRLRKTPPADPVAALTLAALLRYVDLPEEVGKAEARVLIERAVAALPPNHYAAVSARVRLLDEQDQREQALRVLESLPPGPGMFDQRVRLVRALRFQAEVVPLLREWAAAVPRDPRPLWQLATALGDSRDGQELLRLRKAALALHGAAGGDYGYVARSALDQGDYATAEAMLERTQPAASYSAAKARQFWLYDLAVARGDDAAAAAALRAVESAPDVDTGDLRQAAGFWQMRGDRDAVERCLQHSLQLDADQPVLREWLAQLRREPGDEATFAPFRRDGAAAAAAFVAGDREQTASATLVVDQRIVVYAADGSSTAEVHELRRINDQSGVESFGQSVGLGHAEDLLLVRTIAADGTIWVPSRIDDDYSLQRLAPGAFVEWRFRERSAAPGAEPLSTGLWHFGGGHEPCALSELVLITPAQGRGELRTRNLGAPVRDEALPDGRRVRVFRLENIEALPEAPFLPSIAEMLPCLQFGEDATPFAELRDHAFQFGARSRVTAPIRELATELFADCADDRAKVQKAYDWCQVNVEDGSADALDTLLRKKGSRVLLTAALLRAGGVTVQAFGCPEQRADFRDGREELFATTDQIALPGAAVLLADGGWIPLFSDMPRYWPLDKTSALRAGCTAWLVGDDGIAPRTLATTDGAIQSLRVTGRAVIDGRDVVVRATGELGDLPGYSLAQRLREQKQNVQKMAARQIASQLFPGWRVEQAKLVSGPESPLQIEVEVRKAAVQQNGDTFVAQLPMPPSKLVSRYGDRGERTRPFRFTVDESSTWQIAFDPGEELRVARIPEAVDLQAEALHFSQTCARSADGLVFTRRVRVRPQTIEVADFAAWLAGLAAADRAEQATIDLAKR